MPGPSWVEFGNDNAVEGYKEDGSDEVRFRRVEGQQVTVVRFPEDGSVPLLEAFQTAVAVVAGDAHFEGDAKPKWVNSDNDALASLLSEHFDCPAKALPASWGTKALRANPHLPSNEGADLAPAADADEE